MREACFERWEGLRGPYEKLVAEWRREREELETKQAGREVRKAALKEDAEYTDAWIKAING